MEDDLYFAREKILPIPAQNFPGIRLEHAYYTFTCRPFQEVTQMEKKQKEKTFYRQNLSLFIQRAQKKKDNTKSQRFCLKIPKMT